MKVRTSERSERTVEKRSQLPDEMSGTERPWAELDLSVVVLLERHRRTARDIYEEYAPVLRRSGLSFEFLFISGPGGAEAVKPLPDTGDTEDEVRLLEVAQQVGQSAILRLSVEHSRGEIIVTLPPAFRVAPEALPELVRQVHAGADVAVARRWPRKDGWINRLQTGFVTWMLNALTGARLHDITCRVSAIRRDVLAEIPLYGSYFRFIPIVADREGFQVVEIPVRQHPRGGETRIYRPGVYLGWAIDIFGIFFLLRFTYRPLRFFGSVGAVFGVIGGAMLFVLLVQRLGGQGIANRPMLLLGVLLVTFGVQSVALGLIGEIVVHFQASRGSTYRMARDERPTEP